MVKSLLEPTIEYTENRERDLDIERPKNQNRNKLAKSDGGPTNKAHRPHSPHLPPPPHHAPRSSKAKILFQEQKKLF